MGLLSVLLFLEHSPPLYHAYTTMTVFLWTQIVSEYWLIKALWKHLHGRKFNYIVKLLVTTVVSVVILEFLVWISIYYILSCCCHDEVIAYIPTDVFWYLVQVNSFTDRKLYTWCFLTIGVTASLYLYNSIPWRSGIPIFVCIACWFLSVFTLMPAEIPDNNQLV